MLGINLSVFTLGSIVCALRPIFAVLCMFRAVVGFGVGGEISTAVTMLAEFCSPNFRGTAVGLVNVGAGGFGNFLAPAFGLLIFSLFPGENAWRWLFAASAFPALLIVFYRRFVPETPRYLVVAQARSTEANQRAFDPRLGIARPENLEALLSHPDARCSPSGAADGGSWSEIFQPALSDAGPFRSRSRS